MIFFHGHKIILESNCTLFEAFLDTANSFEGEKKMTVPLENVETDGFKLIQRYLYGLDLNIDKSNALLLLELSNKNLVSGLERLVIDYVLEHDEEFDLCQVYKMASKLGVQDLSQYLIWYFQIHYHELKETYFKELPMAVQEQIATGRWPPEKNEAEYRKWKLKYDEEAQIQRPPPIFPSPISNLGKPHKEICLIQ